MRTLFIILTGLGLVFAQGCSKSEEASPDSPAAEAPVTESSPPAGAPPAVPTAEVKQAIQNRQYDRAVDTLTQVAPTVNRMSDAQRLQYQQAVQDAAAALLAAQNSDPAAKAAYNRLARTATGR